MDSSSPAPWQPSACILCSINCGIEVQTDGEGLTKIRGDRAHPVSQGYTCEKAHRLDHYQRYSGRLSAPLKRQPDGTFAEVSWDEAIAGAAAALKGIGDEHGGEALLYYGGGGQGNHLPGAYAAATRAALNIRWASNALAQEKTGEFWVDGQLFGSPQCHTAPDMEHAEVAIFLGKNPWQSHGIPRARVILKELARDPERTLVVIDPRRTETAAMADVHLQVRPGTDAYVLAALGAVLVQEDLVDHTFIAQRARDAEPLTGRLRAIDVDAFCAHAGVAAADVRALARRIGTAAGGVSILEDLGVQQAPHSTLSSYLEKALILLTGNFGIAGGVNLHTAMGNLIGRGMGDRRTPIGGHRVIAGMVPCNAIPELILADDERRVRGMLVESANPVHSLADGPRMREALERLDALVVIDVALTETAQLADWVLPACSQFEKWETTFFTLEFPHNAIHLRAPVLPPRPGTLAEPEIHRRLVRATGALTDEPLAPLHAAAAQGRAAYAQAFMTALGASPALGRLAPVVLYETLGPTLPDGAAAAAVLWGAAQQAFMTYPDAVRAAGFENADALFDEILANPHGVVFSTDEYEATWSRIRHADGRINLAIAELLEELDTLDPSAADATPDLPLVLSAGERRTSTANTIFRDPSWRRRDGEGALRVSLADAQALGLIDGGRARVTTRRGSAVARVEVTDTMRAGHISLPNGMGMGGDDPAVRVNDLTSSGDRDPIAGTPHHKHVRARVEPVA